uniref:Uncharacterized protein n=1 Tax=Ditylenchus dipsaci TaxID=166011 RepID=A0A915CWA4_9BILA
MEISSNSESGEENVSHQKMPLYIREVAIEGIDESQKRGGSNGAFLRSRKLRLWRKGIATGRYRYGFQNIRAEYEFFMRFQASRKFPGVLSSRCSRYKPESPCNGRGFTVRGMFHVTAEHSHNNKRNGGLGFESYSCLRFKPRLRKETDWLLTIDNTTETLVKKVRHGASRRCVQHIPSRDSMVADFERRAKGSAQKYRQ